MQKIPLPLIVALIFLAAAGLACNLVSGLGEGGRLQATARALGTEIEPGGLLGTAQAMATKALQGGVVKTIQALVTEQGPSVAATAKAIATERGPELAETARALATQKGPELLDTAQALVTEQAPVLETMQSAFTQEGPALAETAKALATEVGPEIQATAQALQTQMASGQVPPDIPLAAGEKQHLYLSPEVISYGTSLSLKEVMEFYEQSMPLQGWEKDLNGTVVSDIAAVLLYKKGARQAIITLSINPITNSTLVLITLQGS